MAEKYINRHDLLKKLGTFNWNIMIMRPELFEMVAEKIIHYIFTKIEEFPYIEIENDKCIYGKWIPVSERLPKLGEMVVVYMHSAIYGDEVKIDRMVISNTTDTPYWSYYKGRVKAWMRLPEPPKEETDG